MASEEVFRLGSCLVDLARAQVVWDDGAVHALTPMEVRLLAHLAAHRGRLFTSRQLLTDVWGYHERVRSRAASVAVNRLRQKIERDPSDPQWLLSRYGAGYALRAADDAGVASDVYLAIPAHLDGPDHRRQVVLLLEKAEPLARRLERAEPAHGAHIAALLCRLGTLVHDYEPPLLACRRVVATAPDGVRHLALAALYTYLRRSTDWSGVVEEALAEVAALPSPPTHEGHVALRVATVSLLFKAARADEAQALAESTLRQARLLGLRYHAGTLLTLLGGVANGRGEHAHARQLHLDALRQLRRPGFQRAIAVATHDLAIADYSAGDLAPAAEGLREAIGLLDALGAQHHANFARLNLAAILLCLGEDDEAYERATRTLEEVEDTEVHAEAFALHVQAQVHLLRLELSEAASLMQRAHHLASDSRLGIVTFHARRYLGVIALLSGETDEARRWFRATRSLAGDDWAQAVLLYWWSLTYPDGHATRRRLRVQVDRVGDVPLGLAALDGEDPARTGRWSYDERLTAVVRRALR